MTNTLVEKLSVKCIGLHQTKTSEFKYKFEFFNGDINNLCLQVKAKDILPFIGVSNQYSLCVHDKTLISFYLIIKCIEMEHRHLFQRTI